MKKIILILMFSILSFAYSKDVSVIDADDSYQWYSKAKYLYKHKYEENDTKDSKDQIFIIFKCIEKSLELNPYNKDAKELRKKIFPRVEKIRAIENERLKKLEEIEKKRLAELERIRKEKERKKREEEMRLKGLDNVNYLNGLVFLKNFELKKAIFEFQTAVKYEARNLMAYYYLYKIYRSDRKYEKALKMAENFPKLMKSTNNRPVKDRIKKDFFCFHKLMRLNIAIQQLNLDEEINGKLMIEYLENVFKTEEVTKKDLTIPFLIEKNLLSEYPKCPSQGKYYFNNDNLLECSKHSILFEKEFDEIKFAVVQSFERARLFNKLGIDHFKIKDYSNAIRKFKVAIEASPNYVEPYNNLAIVYKILRDYNKAIKLLEEAVKIDFTYSNAYMNLGNIYDDLKNYKKALEYFKKSLEYTKNRITVYYNMGITYYKMNDFNNAIDNFTKVLDADNSDKGARFFYALSFLKKGKIDFALKNLKELYEKLDPKLPLTKYLRIFMSNIIELKTLKKDIDLAVKKDKKTGDMSKYNEYFNLGVVYYDLLKYQKAETEFRNSLKFDENNDLAYYYLTKIEMEKGDYESALVLIKKAFMLKRTKEYEKLYYSIQRIIGNLYKLKRIKNVK